MNYHLLTCIVGESQSHKLHATIKMLDCVAGVSFLGAGTVQSGLAKLLGIKEEPKEIIHLLIRAEDTHHALLLLSSELHLEKKGSGIAYITRTVGEGMNEEEAMYQKITVITERGGAEEVMDHARAAGATGGTILHGRGTGGHIATRLFGFEIEPEKDVLIILSSDQITQKIVQELEEHFHFNEPGSGILFVEPILKVIGLPEKKQDA